MGAPDPENSLSLGFSVLRGGLRPWFQTMVSEGARPWGRGRSGDCAASVKHLMSCRHSGNYHASRHDYEISSHAIYVPLARNQYINWKATKEYLNQRCTKIRVFRVRFRAPFLPPFFPHFPPSFPFRPCAVSHHFSPFRLPLFYSRKTPI